MKLARMFKNPKALMVTGVIAIVAGSVATGVGAVVMTKELEKDRKKIDELKENAIEAANNEDVVVENEEGEVLETKPSVNDAKQALGIQCIKTAGKVGLCFAPAAGLVVMGLMCVTKSYKILNARNIALTGALTSLSAAFNNYRQRVIEKYGEEEDAALRYGVTEVSIEEIDEKGKSKTVKEKVVSDDVFSDESVIIFDEECKSAFDPDCPEYNVAFLEQIQAQMTTQLTAVGHLFLNEFLDAIGHKRTKEGAVTGWILGEGDGYVDLRIRTFKRQNESGGFQIVYILDPNTDGVIIDKIDA